MVSEKMVKKVAEVARLQLTEKERKQFRKDLQDILKAFSVLDKVPKAEPSFQPIEIKNTTRKDEVEPSLTQKEALANTSLKEKGFFKGPRVV